MKTILNGLRLYIGFVEYFLFSFALFGLIALAGCRTSYKSQKEAWRSVSQDSSLSYQEINKKGEAHARMVLPNGLEVLLISSPSIQKSSAAMAVPVGSWADPKEHLGLAHFLEHMLFLGNREFPDVGEFGNFLRTNSGYTNAYTAKELTNYMVEVNPDALDGTLNRFSKFFISPTLDPKFADREKNAVHSEYDKNIQDDGWRMWASLIGHLSPEGHPLRKFNIGSLKTLANVDSKTLRDFYESHYSSDTMKLVIMSKHSLSDLRTLAEKYFLEVPHRNLRGKNSNPVPPENWRGGTLIEMKTLESKNQIVLSFPVPTFNGKWRAKPERILENILGSKTKGSLLSHLKRRNLATDLAVMNFDMVDYGSETSLIFVMIDLTDQGGQSRDEVVRTALSHFAKIRADGYKDYTFQENQTMAKLSYESKQVRDGARVASEYARNMLSYPALEIDERTLLIFHNDGELIDFYLKQMTSDKMSIIHMNQKIKGTRRDPFYGTEYNLSRLTESQIKSFAAVSQRPLAGTTYPPANVYIPTNLDLYKNQSTRWPVPLFDNQKRLWFFQETSANTKPRGFLSLRVLSSAAGESARSSLLTQLYAKSIIYSATEQIDQMKRAGYDLEIDASPFGIEVSLRGYSGSFPAAVQSLLASKENILRNVRISEESFRAIRQTLQREIESADQDSAIDVLIQNANFYRHPRNFRLVDYKPFAAQVSLQDLKSFVDRFYQKISIDGMIYGNLKKEDFSFLAQDFVAAMGSQEMTENEVSSLLGKEKTLGSSQKFAHVAAGANNNNAMVSFVETGSAEPENYALSQLVGNMISSDYFTEMRTHQQLGYIVQGGFSVRASKDASRLVFLIQSANHSAESLIQKSDTFLRNYLTQMDRKIDQNLKASAQGLVTEWKSRPTDMDNKFKDFVQLQRNRKANFRFYEELIQEVQKITPEKAKEFARTYFDPSKQNRFSFYYSGKNNPSAKPAEGEVGVSDRDDFFKKTNP
jgi:insulysin